MSPLDSTMSHLPPGVLLQQYLPGDQRPRLNTSEHLFKLARTKQSRCIGKFVGECLDYPHEVVCPVHARL